ncbi:hypothetical protein AC1031_012449 [Aphanomyces cochlioides]|nr:hypothetical protein AC1031_012449 [Aphanomyces cochlioides]
MVLLGAFIAHIVSLMYPDVIRLYSVAPCYLWVVTTLLVATFVISACFFTLALLQMIPSWWIAQYGVVMDEFYHSIRPTLTLNICVQVVLFPETV